jgi:hypothetical protein
VKKSFSLLALIATLAALIATAPGSGALVALAATPPPTPPVLPAFSPAPLATPGGAATSPLPQASPNAPGVTLPGSHHGSARATPSPPPDKRKGIEGVWEVQIQRGATTQYVHFKLRQNQNAITGVYMDPSNKQFPLAGSLDGKSVRIVVTLTDGSSITFTAQLDGTTDMLGMLTTTNESTPFTAAYRPKEDFMDNINAAPGGMGAPTGGGGYNPP